MSAIVQSNPTKKILIANRGEIATRIVRILAELGWCSVVVYAEDDRESLAVLQADVSVPLTVIGPAGYLDMDELISVAKRERCDAIHPGYGFLSESAEFARRCASLNMVFLGPEASTLELLGNKAEARALAQNLGVPILEGIDTPVDLNQALNFFDGLPNGSAMVIKAISGGGGRGMRVVTDRAQVQEAFTRCQSEALTAFADDRVYVERWAPQARHVEVQIVGDGEQVVHLFERECTLQRNHQKLVEYAPSPSIDSELRQKLCQAAISMASHVNYIGLGTFEFLLFESASNSESEGQVQEKAQLEFVFIEANPRIQVEHTVTEELLGLDLVQLQLLLHPQLNTGISLQQLPLDQLPCPQGYALQARINAETILPDATVKPSAGTLTSFDVPNGNGVRVDTYVYGGYSTSPRYDSLLAKLVVRGLTADFPAILRKALLALKGFRIEGIATNLDFLQALLKHPEVQNNQFHTGFIQQHLDSLLTQKGEHILPATQEQSHFETSFQVQSESAVLAPLAGTLRTLSVTPGQRVEKGDELLVLDAMKMEHVISAPGNGQVEALYCGEGDAIAEGQPLLEFIVDGEQTEVESQQQIQDLDFIRADLEQVNQRHGYGFDENRPDAVAKRRATGQRTARENIEDLCDKDSFVEYGSLVVAAQRRRRTLQDLMEKTPGDGMVTGLATVNAEQFGAEASRRVVMSYDYTVLAGTQGIQNHHKKDRMFELAKQMKLPLVLFSEGGGGRPGDTDSLGSSASLDCLAFLYFARLSGLVPLVGIASGRNFAGNAALLGCCDVVIATQNANIGMGGPAMIEGGGLGSYTPEQVGPSSVQANNGVIDVLVEDEAAAVTVAKQYLSYFQGELTSWEVADQRLLRSLIPENRLRVYNVRDVIDTMMDCGTVLELRRGFGKGMITALARIEGKAVGVVANNPMHLSGAIDSDNADKAARFMQLCDAYDVPIVFLCDTPGIMVGPEVEKTALVKHAARMFVTAASLSVPFFTIVLRKAYGLGAMTMAGGTLKAPVFTVSWPTGEFGAMGLEGAVKLGFRKELEAETDPDKKQQLFDSMVADMYERGKAVNTATFFEFDDVIDPVDSRKWLLAGLEAAPEVMESPTLGKKRPCIDTW